MTHPFFYRVERVFVTVMLAAGLCSACVLGYWWFWPYEVIRPFADLSKPVPVMTPLVKQGGVLIYSVGLCKTTSIVGTINRAFVDGLVFEMPPVKALMARGCRDGEQSEVAVQVPMTLPPGRYHLEAEVSYRVNPIRTMTYSFVTQTFVVEPHQWRLSARTSDEDVAASP